MGGMACVDLEGAAGYVGAEHDITFVLVEGGDVTGPDLEACKVVGGWRVLFIGKTAVSP